MPERHENSLEELAAEVGKALRLAASGRFGEFSEASGRLEQHVSRLGPNGAGGLRADRAAGVRQGIEAARAALEHIAAVQRALRRLESDEDAAGPEAGRLDLEA